MRSRGKEGGGREGGGGREEEREGGREGGRGGVIDTLYWTHHVAFLSPYSLSLTSIPTFSH